MGQTILGYYLDNPDKCFDVKPEWYILALDTFEKSKLN